MHFTTTAKKQPDDFQIDYLKTYYVPTLISIAKRLAERFECAVNLGKKKEASKLGTKVIETLHHELEDFLFLDSSKIFFHKKNNLGKLFSIFVNNY